MVLFDIIFTKLIVLLKLGVVRDLSSHKPRENNDFAVKSDVLRSSGYFYKRSVGAGP